MSKVVNPITTDSRLGVSCVGGEACGYTRHPIRIFHTKSMGRIAEGQEAIHPSRARQAVVRLKQMLTQQKGF